jgi:hypothetical protein
MNVTEINNAIEAEYERLGVRSWMPEFGTASESELTQAEAHLGFALPADYRQFLSVNALGHPFDGNFQCSPLERMLRSSDLMRELLNEGKFDQFHGRIQDDRIKTWWSTAWLPVAEDSCGNMRCLDTAENRVVFMEVQDAQGPFLSPFKDFTAFLEHHLGLLRRNKVQVYDGWFEVDSYM